MSRRLYRVALAGLAAILIAGCASEEVLSPAMKPLSKEALVLLAKKGMQPESPIYIRIFKEESELEVWKVREDSHYYHYKTYPICNWSGDLGPKVKQGDKQSPEGFYMVAKHQMNPKSSFHLAFNIGFPNPYDKANGRTGEFLMVHGDCRSAGCYAMTDALIEEIYALAREAFAGGQPAFPVHAFPFRMTDENMKRHKGHPAYGFWQTMKPGYDHFEAARQPPSVAICERRYIVNVKAGTGKIDPQSACPALERVPSTPFTPDPKMVTADATTVVAPGRKMRVAGVPYTSPPAGLTKSGTAFRWPTFGGQSSQSTGLGFGQAP